MKRANYELVGAAFATTRYAMDTITFDCPRLSDEGLSGSFVFIDATQMGEPVVFRSSAFLTTDIAHEDQEDAA